MLHSRVVFPVGVDACVRSFKTLKETDPYASWNAFLCNVLLAMVLDSLTLIVVILICDCAQHPFVMHGQARDVDD